MNQKISSLVKYQFPEFVRTNYETFIAFIEAYYKFLEQDQEAFELVQNSKSYIDVDSTASDFIQYFLNTHARNIPPTVLANKPLLIKNIKDLYESKGSKTSFKMLFRILWNDSIDIRYPYENVLIPSAGEWEQLISIRVARISGDISQITNHLSSITKNGITYQFIINRVKILSTGQYELYIDWKNDVIPFEVNDVVAIRDNSSTIFTGRIAPTTTSYTIEEAGSGFKAGDVYTIIGGTIIKVREINSDGGIVSLDFINFGSGYSDDFFIELSESGATTRPSQLLAKTLGFKDTITIYKLLTDADPERYFDSDYTEDFTYAVDESISYTQEESFEESDFVSDSLSYSVATGVALIKFKLGAIAKYRGQYLSSSGFISEYDVRIQDDKLYQPYAYQLQTQVDISEFNNVVKKVVHPAGTNMFSNRNIINSIDISNDVNVTTTVNVISL